MNILFLDQFGEAGGGQQCLLDLMPGILDAGWNPIAAVPEDGPFGERLRKLGVVVEGIRCRRPGFGSGTVMDSIGPGLEILPLAHRIRGLRKKYRAHLLYVNGGRLLPAAALAAGGRPLLFHCHSRFRRSGAVRIVGAALQSRRSTVVAPCRFYAEPFASYVRPERFHVVFNGAAAMDFRPPTAGIRRVGMVGRIAQDKGHTDFIRAARILNAASPDLRFVICGTQMYSRPGYFEEVQKMSRGLPVEFLGWRDDLAAVYSDLDLLVLPSGELEGNPLVVLEAFAAGVPVMAYASGGIPEIIEDRKTGFLVRPSTPEALASAILALRPADLSSVARAARRTWEERFQLARYRREIVQIIADSTG